MVRSKVLSFQFPKNKSNTENDQKSVNTFNYNQLEYNTIQDFNKDSQIPKNQYKKFVERLGPSKANTRFKSNSKGKNQSEGLNFGNFEPIESMIRICKERNDSKACDIPSMLIQVCGYLINKQCTRVVLMRSMIIAHLIIYLYNI